MTALRAEFLKLFTTKAWIWLSAVLVVLAGSGSSVLFYDYTLFPSPITPSAGEEITKFLVESSFLAFSIAIVMGILGITGEFRHQTATPTFLAVPKRGIVVSAKLVTYLFFSLLLGILFVGAIVITAEPILTGAGFTSAFDSPHFFRTLFGTVIGVGFFGLFGVGIGSLIRNQPIPITVSIVYFLLVEKSLLYIHSTQDIFPYLPGSAAEAMIAPNRRLEADVHLLGMGQGALVLAAWSLGLAIIGSIVAVSRDIT